MTRPFPPVLFAAILAALAPSGARAVSGYAECAALAETDPERARNEARAWYEATGALGALHCEAMALTEQGATRLAAEKLAALANAPELTAAESAPVRIQASRLFRAEGDMAAALAALEPALSAGEAAAPAYVERATIRSFSDDWRGVREDLDSALRLKPGDAATLALRAATNRRLGDAARARADAEAAIAADPKEALGWFELGFAAKGDGDETEARRA
ncbi:MAG: hypothetical protein ACK5MQ_05425, partial [Pikeienuella sp.]